MGRYKDGEIVIRDFNNSKKGKAKARETIIYQQIPKRDNDIYLITQVGDRLDNLSNQFYGTPEHWWYIAHANKLFSINLEPNISIRVPADLSFLQLVKR
mgnify:CR=1 FL=1|tara:strand:+ start:1888 stop:2184 length:297 start_codon:yes stop_codon:yes gene_type:complete